MKYRVAADQTARNALEPQSRYLAHEGIRAETGSDISWYLAFQTFFVSDEKILSDVIIVH